MLRVYVGTYTEGSEAGSKGIYVVDFNNRTGELSNVCLAGEISNPSFLAVDPSGRRLYSVSENDEANAFLVGWAIEPDGRLREIGRAATGGGAPCFVAIHSGNRQALVANYSGGSVALFALDASGAPRRLDLLRHQGRSVNPQRQMSPHAHAVQYESNPQRALVADLGTDELLAVDISDTGRMRLNPPRTLKFLGGSGPRHFAFAPEGPFVLVLQELASKITVLRDHGEDFESIGQYSTLPKDFSEENSTAEILFHPRGRFVYASNRGDDSLAVFRFDPVSGVMSALGHVKTGGKTPRNFRLSPDGNWLLAANQDSDTLVVFRVGSDGIPVPTPSQVSIPKPVCLKFAVESRVR